MEYFNLRLNFFHNLDRRHSFIFAFSVIYLFLEFYDYARKIIAEWIKFIHAVQNRFHIFRLLFVMIRWKLSLF